MHQIAIVNEHSVSNVSTIDIIIIMVVMTFALVFFLYLVAMRAARRPYNDRGYPQPEPWASPLPGSATHVGDTGAHLIYPEDGGHEGSKGEAPSTPSKDVGTA